MRKIEIFDVIKNSISDELGIQKGDYLISVNENEIIDILDYKYFMSDEDIIIEIEHNEEITEYIIEKEIYEDIGLIFKNELIDKPKRCMNKCIFCFMDQLPPNMRKTLIFKDDDFRLSFFSGNYITLTNCNEKDIDRIIEYKLSPINISIHTTNSELRKKILNNNRAGEVLKYLDKLYKNNIYMNAQIVLCPDINDKNELINTINDLSKYYPYMQSISVVPVGLTKHREDLYKLRMFNEKELIDTVIDISDLQKKYKKELGSNFVYLSDEFYVKAKLELPDYNHYEDFPQLENGVGMITLFMEEFNKRLKQLYKRKIDMNQKQVSIATGKLACEYIKKCAEILNENFNIHINVYVIENEFWGRNITVTGLVTAQDIINQLKDKKLGEELFICNCMLKEGTVTFLDDKNIEEIEKELNINTIIVENSGKDFINKIIQIKKG